ncbi:hypothetical protein BKA70DRAFT_1259792 [Coprinopsis sp. MPI-PUGE-AT-0042]|nr:hypothetical protein BKA70DRAFT_1259792 [Coprinopsis sp. MPI-PUGE-AT-0042]
MSKGALGFPNSRYCHEAGLRTQAQKLFHPIFFSPIPFNATMKSIILSILVTFALTLQSHAYLDVEDGAFNVRHFHMVKRGENGEIVGRAFGNTYDIVGLETRSKCTTVMACGTAGGCAAMAGQRYCKGEPWNKSFQKAIKQTGANGAASLKMMAEGIGRGPVGMIAGMAKTTAKALVKAKKEKKKRSLAEDEDIVLGRSDVYEFVERDEEMNLVQRGEFMMSESISRDQNGRVGEFLCNRCRIRTEAMACSDEEMRRNERKGLLCLVYNESHFIIS